MNLTLRAESEFFYDPKRYRKHKCFFVVIFSQVTLDYVHLAPQADNRILPRCSKLYYGNKKGAYFSYNETVDPPFVPVQQTITTTAEATSAQQDDSGGRDVASSASRIDQGGSASPSILATDPVLILPNNNITTGGMNAASKPSIAIKLSTKKLGKKKPISAATSPQLSNKDPKVKKELADIEKWTEKQVELKQERHVSLGQPTKQSTCVPVTAATTGDVASNQKLVKTTSKGEPICVICKRKFGSVEKLQRHEQQSELHKQNLKKLEQAKQKSNASYNDNTTASDASTKRKQAPTHAPNESIQQYEDRAQKRRDLHGPIDSTITGITPDVARREIAQNGGSLPVDTLGKDNVGHQLLQKLGWNAENVATGGTASDTIRKEWDQIEARAASARPRGPL